MKKRTTVVLEADDFEFMRIEARRRGISLGALLGESVARDAAVLRGVRPKPRLGVVSVGVSYYDIGEEAASTPFR